MLFRSLIAVAAEGSVKEKLILKADFKGKKFLLSSNMFEALKYLGFNERIIRKFEDKKEMPAVEVDLDGILKLQILG